MTSNGDLPQVPITVDEAAVIEPDQAIAGLIKLSKNKIRELRQVGISMAGAGTMTVQRGSVLVAQQRLDEAMRVLYDEIMDLAADKKAKNRLVNLTRLTQQLGYLTSRLTESGYLVAQMDGTTKAAPMVDPRELVNPMVRPFAPGSTVKPATNMVIAKELHVHQAPQG